jgi:25S rRNA (adenine2142-N1)-methyltransferase
VHHELKKRKARALKKGNDKEVADLSAQMVALGGLPRYQQASLVGQSKDRGGDSSKVLLEWLRPFLPKGDQQNAATRPIKMLEVGALSSTNACSVSSYFQVEHIDLHSCEPGILEQDFMKRPLPGSDAQKFDIISLSLVLNFVPDAADRGEMLRRTLGFLRDARDPSEAPFPAVFIVLPRSCLFNSRYLTQERFGELMGSLSFRELHFRVTSKLVYSLWLRHEAPPCGQSRFRKQETNPGRSRNNFAIVLD